MASEGAEYGPAALAASSRSAKVGTVPSTASPRMTRSRNSCGISPDAAALSAISRVLRVADPAGGQLLVVLRLGAWSEIL